MRGVRRRPHSLVCLQTVAATPSPRAILCAPARSFVRAGVDSCAFFPFRPFVASGRLQMGGAILFGTARAALPWRRVFNLPVESVPVMACCGQSAGCGMLVAGGFCYRMLLDESHIARESQN